MSTRAILVDSHEADTSFLVMTEALLRRGQFEIVELHELTPDLRANQGEDKPAKRFVYRGNGKYGFALYVSE